MAKQQGSIWLIILSIIAVALIIIIVYRYLSIQTKQQTLLSSREERLITNSKPIPKISVQPSNNTLESSSSVNMSPTIDKEIYSNKKYAYTLSFPPDWQLTEEVLTKQDNNVDIRLSDRNNTGSIFLTAAPAGHGCFFMQGPNPNLMRRTFKIEDKSITLEDGCFERTYGTSLKNKTGDKFWLEIIAKDDNSYETIYKILNSIQGLELAE